MGRRQRQSGSKSARSSPVPSTWSAWRSESPEIWHAGPRDSEILFALRRDGLAHVWGRVGRWRATFVVDLDDPRRCSIDLVADAASLDTGHAERDEYARSEAFLDVAHFPEIRFRSSDIVTASDDHLTITGNLTIRGVTREVRFVVGRESDGSPLQHSATLAFKGCVSLPRLGFGLRWKDEPEGGDLVVDDAVDVDLSMKVRPGPK